MDVPVIQRVSGTVLGRRRDALTTTREELPWRRDAWLDRRTYAHARRYQVNDVLYSVPGLLHYLLTSPLVSVVYSLSPEVFVL